MLYLQQSIRKTYSQCCKIDFILIIIVILCVIPISFFATAFQPLKSSKTLYFPGSIQIPYNQHSTLFPSNRYSSDQLHVSSTQLLALMQPFNPFTTRRKNTRIRWFENDLDKFYAFVEAQPLLTAEQELKYGKALKMWLQLERIRVKFQTELNMTTRMTDLELSKQLGCSESTLQKMYKYSQLSKVRLCNSNMKLVLAVVSRYRSSNIANSELIAEGTRGLARAVLRYDYTKGFRFATYATWYVHQAVAEYVRIRKHPAKMPSRYLLLLRKVKQFSTDYRSENKRLPSVNEIADALKESKFDINKVLTMQTFPMLLNQQLGSKNSYKSDAKERSLEEIIPSVYKAPSAHSDSRHLRSDMESMMSLNLNDVERDILRLRLGLDDGRSKPVKEVGRKFSISWKQVRTVERSALTKLSHSKEISDFVSSFHSV